MNRTRRERFLVVAERRTRRALKYIQIIGNTANHRAYDYEPDEARQIIKALRDEVAALETKLIGVQSRDFSLRSTRA